MTRIELVEGTVTRNVALTGAQAWHLGRLQPLIRGLRPSQVPGTFDVETGHRVGIVQVDDLTVVTTPKLPIASLMWLVGYAAAGIAIDTDTALQPSDWMEAFAAVYLQVARETLTPGLLRGYKTIETTDTVLRGRLRIPDQLHRHHGRLHPLELVHDEHGIDIAENQIVQAALTTLVDALHLAENPTQTHRTITTGLHALTRTLTGITPLTPGAPRPTWRASLLNERYQPLLALSELVLDGAGLDAQQGQVQAKGFIINTPAVFERAFVRGLRACNPTGVVQAQRSDPYIDGTGHRLRPDIAITHHGRVVSILDTKYKTSHPAPSDIYQMHAYASFYRVNDVHLVYAEALPATHGPLHISGTATTIHCHGIDLTRPGGSFLDQVRAIAHNCQITP